MKQLFKDTALLHIKTVGLINLSREDLCDELGIAPGSFASVVGVSFKEFVEELREEGHTGPYIEVSRARAHPELRKEQILETSIRAAQKYGYRNITRGIIVEAAKISRPLITRYFDNFGGLKRAIMLEAIEREIVEIVAQGLGAGDEVARGAPEKLKQKALKYLL